MTVGGRRRHRAWFGTRGAGPATHHPAGEEEGEGSLAGMGEGDWLKAVIKLLLLSPDAKAG